MMGTTTVDTIIPLCRDYYRRGNPTGGNLHIVLDDGNVENGNLDFCEQRAQEDRDTEALMLIGLLRGLSVEQREELHERYGEYRDDGEWPDAPWPRKGER